MMERSTDRLRESIPVIILSLVALVFYLTLIYHTLTIYWNDAHIRWALREELLLGEWLPGVQIFVFLVSKISSNLDFLQSFLALLAIGALICFYILARYLFSPATGFVAFLFLAFNSMFAAFAIVPYSEILFVGLIFSIIILLEEPVFSKKFYFGIFLINMASLASYSGWFLAIFFIIETAFRSFQTVKWQAAIWQTLKMGFLCSLALMTWLMLASGGLIDRLNSIFQFVIAPSAPSVNDHILARMNINYILDFSSQFFSLLTKQIHIEFLILSVVGVSFAILSTSHKSVHRRIFLLLILNLFLLIFFQPWKFGSLRQPFFIQAFLVLYSSYGLVSCISWVFQGIASLMKNADMIHWVKHFIVAAAIALTVRIIPSTYNFIVNTSNEADFLTPHKIAKWLEPRLKNEDAILIIDDTDYYPYALASYFEYPLEHILDDRLDTDLIQENLENAQMVYIIELYKARDGLSLTEANIVEALESGQIQAERFVFDGANVWYAAANKVSYSSNDSAP